MQDFDRFLYFIAYECECINCDAIVVRVIIYFVSILITDLPSLIIIEYF